MSKNNNISTLNEALPNQAEQISINSEIVWPDDRKELQELKKRLLREHEEREKKARREKWKRILGLGLFFKK